MLNDSPACRSLCTSIHRNIQRFWLWVCVQLQRPTARVSGALLEHRCHLVLLMIIDWHCPSYASRVPWESWSIRSPHTRKIPSSSLGGTTFCIDFKFWFQPSFLLTCTAGSECLHFAKSLLHSPANLNGHRLFTGFPPCAEWASLCEEPHHLFETHPSLAFHQQQEGSRVAAQPEEGRGKAACSLKRTSGTLPPLRLG